MNPRSSHPSRRRLLALGTAGAALALGLPAARAEVAPSNPAPDFTLRSLDGPNLRLQEQRGKVVMLNFWATWCGPCREEMPQLNKLFEKFRPSGFTLLGVNVDEDSRQAAGIAGQLGVKFPVLFDSDKRVAKLYELSAMPSTVLIDRDGRVRFLNRGYHSGVEAEYDRQIRALLKE
jgi:peroxiredoxin